MQPCICKEEVGEEAPLGPQPASFPASALRVSIPYSALCLVLHVLMSTMAHGWGRGHGKFHLVDDKLDLQRQRVKTRPRSLYFSPSFLLDNIAAGSPPAKAALGASHWLSPRLKPAWR